MGWDNNPVNDPAGFGFDEVVGEVYLSAPSYDFDLLAVLKDKDGYWLGTDSGCSCPSPWESHTREDFTGPLTAEQAKEEATSLWTHSYGNMYEPEEFNALLDSIV